MLLYEHIIKLNSTMEVGAVRCRETNRGRWRFQRFTFTREHIYTLQAHEGDSTKPSFPQHIFYKVGIQYIPHLCVLCTIAEAVAQP